jgi:hypothetical protein
VKAALSSVGWGIYLACSWTWCIGLYLPALMVERWGWPGFIAFAVPNVLGCAAFGYVVKSRDRSEAMVARHGKAMTWFSVITVAYHVFFIAWLLAEIAALVRPTLAPAAAVAAAVIAAGIMTATDRGWLSLAVAVLGLSLAATVAVGVEGAKSIGWSGEQSFVRLAAIAPLLCTGFLLCPYLDLTFHRALQRSPTRHAFAVFGIAFLVMILLSCLIWVPRGTVLPALVMAHVLAQCVFTMGAHLREIRLSGHARRGSLALGAVAGGIALAAIGALSRPDAGGTIYLAFLVLFYGLLFPAWVALTMIRRARSTPTSR